MSILLGGWYVLNEVRVCVTAANRELTPCPATRFSSGGV